jgi:hypothetical protein
VSHRHHHLSFKKQVYFFMASVFLVHFLLLFFQNHLLLFPSPYFQCPQHFLLKLFRLSLVHHLIKVHQTFRNVDR